MRISKEDYMQPNIKAQYLIGGIIYNNILPLFLVIQPETPPFRAESGFIASTQNKDPKFKWSEDLLR